MFNQDIFDDVIIMNNIIGVKEEDFKLASGRMSPHYVNWRSLTTNPKYLPYISSALIDFAHIKGLEPDTFYGVPEGIDTLAVVTQYEFARRHIDPENYQIAMGRGKPKDHGAPENRSYVSKPKGHTIVLEDVTTTGGSLIRCIEQLKKDDVIVIAAIALTNRGEMIHVEYGERIDVEHYLSEELDVPYFAMSNATVLLEKMHREQVFGDVERDRIQQYFKKYCMRKINF